MTEKSAKPEKIATPDYEFWAQMPGWTVAEAAALFLDIDPDCIPNKDTERETPGWRYQRLHRLLKRAKQMDELSSPMAPREFLAWASSNGVKPPDGLEVPVRAGKPHRNWKTRYFKVKRERDRLKMELREMNEYAKETLKQKERTSLLKLVAGMARAKFGHKTGMTSASKSIGSSLNLHGVQLSDNSIRSYLAESDTVVDEK